MRRVIKKEMPENIKMMLDSVLAEIPAKANINYVSFSVDPSIRRLYNIGQTAFNPRLTPENFYTYGATYKNLVKLVNTVIGCEHITDIKVTFNRKYKYGYIIPAHVKANIGTSNERFSFDYSVCIKFIGMTPEREQELRELAEKKERERIAAEEYRKKVTDHISYWKELHKDEKYEFAGCANSWNDNIPEIVKIANNDPDCFYTEREVGRCVTEYICHKYKFYYTIDSSD